MPDRLLLSADDKTEEEEEDESMTVVCVDDNIPSQSMSVDDSIINTTQHTVEGWSATHNNFFSQQMGMCHFGVRGFASHQTTRGVVLFHVEVHCGTTCIHNDARQNLLDLYKHHNQPMDNDDDDDKDSHARKQKPSFDHCELPPMQSMIRHNTKK